jgi:hypothetical protein
MFRFIRYFLTDTISLSMIAVYLPLGCISLFISRCESLRFPEPDSEFSILFTVKMKILLSHWALAPHVSEFIWPLPFWGCLPPVQNLRTFRLPYVCIRPCFDLLDAQVSQHATAGGQKRNYSATGSTGSRKHNTGGSKRLL